ncbi:hypothetical protein ACFL0J_00060 [Candidatus Neomarinimicrobiota bacterium]
MKINTKALALSMGILGGLAIFLLTIWFLIMGYSGNFLNKLSCVYLGYSVSLIGAVIGFAYGFFDGLIGGALLGYFYNKFAK